MTTTKTKIDEFSLVVSKGIVLAVFCWPATYAWNLGLVPAIEGIHLIDYWQMFYITCLALFFQGKL